MMTVIPAEEEDIKRIAELVFRYETEWIIFPHDMRKHDTL